MTWLQAISASPPQNDAGSCRSCWCCGNWHWQYSVGSAGLDCLDALQLRHIRQSATAMWKPILPDGTGASWFVQDAKGRTLHLEAEPDRSIAVSSLGWPSRAASRGTDTSIRKSPCGTYACFCRKILHMGSTPVRSQWLCYCYYENNCYMN